MASSTSTSIVVTPLVLGSGSPAQHHHHPHHRSPFTATPSPFNNSITSTSWSFTAVFFRHSNLFFRAFAFLFSFASTLCLVAPAPPNNKGQAPFTFLHHPEFRYCMSMAIVASLYSAIQLFKGICDIAFKGLIIPDMISDYITFFFDQVVAYLLLSASSVAVLTTQSVVAKTFKRAAIVSTCMSFAAFLAIATCSLLSGYKLCKRIIWYCMSVAIVASLYSAIQLFKGICDIAFKGLIIPDMISDYITFFFDQVVAYLLLSASSVAVLTTQSVVAKTFKRAAIVSTCMSFAAFLAIATCSLLSGYKLCKRIIW